MPMSTGYRRTCLSISYHMPCSGGDCITWSFVLLPMPSLSCFPRLLLSPLPPSSDLSFSSGPLLFLSMYSFSLLLITFPWPLFSLPRIAHFFFLSSPTFLVPALCQPQAGSPVRAGRVGGCLLEGLLGTPPRAESWSSHAPLTAQQPWRDRAPSTLKSQQPNSDKTPLCAWELTYFFRFIISLKYILQWWQKAHFSCKHPPFLPNFTALLQSMGVQSSNGMTVLLILTWRGTWVFLPHTVLRYGWTSKMLKPED